MKWVVDKILKEQTWYSKDVIDKIISECEQRMCDTESCDPECECIPKLILDILEKEET